MDLKDYRKEIDAIDGELLPLFLRRMELAAEIAAYKRENGLRVRDARREEEKLRAVEERTPEELRGYARDFYVRLFELSRARQESLSDGEETR